MKNEQRYGTFLVTEPELAEASWPATDGVGWGLAYRDDPSHRHWAAPDGRSVTIKSRSPTDEELRFHIGWHVPCQELIIEAFDETMAHNVCSLMLGGILLAYPEAINLPDDASVYPVDEVTEDMLTSSPMAGEFTHQRNAAFGADVARRAWGDDSLIYGIEKYRLSLHLDWFTPHSAAPRYGQVFGNDRPEYSYHAQAAYAIVIAYSVSEELGLEVRSSSQRPRFIGNDKDEWNPRVKEDLVERLAAAGVDHQEPFVWIHRGDPTEVEKAVKPRLGSPATYAHGEVVRDREMELVDAIHQASYLRNFITAHKFSDLVKSIGPYDVHNAQLLARRLLLSRLGLWGPK
jgi:hypothetical protein